MTQLLAKITRRLALWQKRWRYEFGREMSASQVAARHAPGVTWRDDQELLARHLAAMPAVPARHAAGTDDTRFHLLGRELTFAGDWHTDPFFGVRWPRVYVGALSDARRGSDVVLLWELNRMFFMLDRAARYQETQEEKHSAACFALMRSWSEQNRFMVGKNWRSPMEAGIRLVVWSQTLSALRKAKLPPNRDCGLIVRSVLRQCEFLANNFSRAMPPNNHLVGEAATLFAVATYWPQLRSAGDWRARAETALVQEAQRQILSDGIQYEMALNYHLFVLDFFLLYLHAKALRGETPANELLERVEQMIVALLRFVSPTGRVPRVGDDSTDDFLVLKSQEDMEVQPVSDALQFRSFVRDGYVHQLESTDWGCELLNQSQPTRCNARFSASGLVSMRDSNRQLIVSAGPQHNHPFASGHMHSDSGSFELVMGATPVVIDKGTYLYTYDRELREHFRSAAAHNTVVIDDLDPMQSESTFAWRNNYAGILGDLVESAGISYTSVIRELSGRDGSPLRHVRIFAALGDILVVADSVCPIEGESAAVAQWRFHLPFHGPRVERTGSRITIADARSLPCVVDVFGCEPELVQGADDVETMYSCRYGEVRNGTLVRFARGVGTGAATTSVFHDGSSDIAVDQLNSAAAALRVAGAKGARLVNFTFAPPRVALGNDG